MKTAIFGWNRFAMAIEEIQDRLIRSTKESNSAIIPYAVVGDHAVAESVGKIDQGAMRFTKDVAFLLRRAMRRGLKNLYHPRHLVGIN